MGPFPGPPDKTPTLKIAGPARRRASYRPPGKANWEHTGRCMQYHAARFFAAEGHVFDFCNFTNDETNARVELDIRLINYYGNRHLLGIEVRYLLSSRQPAVDFPSRPLRALSGGLRYTIIPTLLAPPTPHPVLLLITSLLCVISDPLWTDRSLAGIHTPKPPTPLAAAAPIYPLLHAQPRVCSESPTDPSSSSSHGIP
jgi:hypothetical protein